MSWLVGIIAFVVGVAVGALGLMLWACASCWREESQGDGSVEAQGC